MKVKKHVQRNLHPQMTLTIDTAGTVSFRNKSNKQTITTQLPTCVLCVVDIALVINMSPCVQPKGGIEL